MGLLRRTAIIAVLWSERCTFENLEIQTECFNLLQCDVRIQGVERHGELWMNPIRSVVSSYSFMRHSSQQRRHLRREELSHVPIRHEVLRVYETGALTVVGFGSDHLPDHI